MRSRLPTRHRTWPPPCCWRLRPREDSRRANVVPRLPLTVEFALAVVLCTACTPSTRNARSGVRLVERFAPPGWIVPPHGIAICSTAANGAAHEERSTTRGPPIPWVLARKLRLVTTDLSQWITPRDHGTAHFV
jgi:hypothetical protein